MGMKAGPREQPWVSQTNAELLEAIRADVSNPDPYLVYADWLSEQGDPRGEFIVLQHQRTERGYLHPSSEELATLARCGDFVGGQLDSEEATMRWRLGFVEMVRLFHYRDWMNDDYDVLPLVRRIFSSTASALVRELRIGVIRWMHNATDVPRILVEVASLGRAAGIRELHLGDVYDIDCDLAHHQLGKLDVLARSYPALEVLHMRGSEFEFSDLPSERMRELCIETCDLARAELSTISKTSWPELVKLDLWFGSSGYGCDVEADDLAPLLKGTHLPELQHLALANAEFTNELCELLPDAPILSQLKVLDLSKGCMDDQGARSLATSPERLRHLDYLDVSANFLSEAGIARLSKLGCRVVADRQRDVDDSTGEALRYVAVGE